MRVRRVFCALAPSLAILILLALGFRLVVPLTDSMEPAIPRGSLVVVAPAWLREPRVGDAALYRLRLGGNEYLILHRIIRAVNGTCFVTKGDNRGFTDPWLVRREDVVGVTILVIPLLGFILLLARPLIIPAAAGLIVFYSARLLIKWALQADDKEKRK